VAALSLTLAQFYQRLACYKSQFVSAILAAICWRQPASCLADLLFAPRVRRLCLMSGKLAALGTLLFLAAPIPMAGQSPSAYRAQRLDRVVSRCQKLLVADDGKVTCTKGVTL
jgi:hypothetical protein